MRIQRVHARQILDSRGNPTLEVDLLTNNALGTASVPSGASTGVHEAIELRDGGVSYRGKNVSKAVKNVNKTINEALKGSTVDEQKELDSKLNALDGTKEKKKLGSNAILGVSMAATRASASENKLHLFEYISALHNVKKYVLPVPFANIINGGVHAGNKLQFQEIMIAPIHAKSFSEATRIIVEIYQELKDIIALEYSKQSTSVGDEGGFSPNIQTVEEGLDLIKKAAWATGYTKKIAFAIDAAASEFYVKEQNKYEVMPGKFFTKKELIQYYVDLTKKYNIISIEDPFHEDDYDSFKELTLKIGDHVQIVGDDLTVSNPNRINYCASLKACNALLLKINQIGTISEALEAADIAENNDWKIMVSHRSGETDDSYIADLAVGIGCGQIKLGAPARGERTAKYNQLLRIEEYLGRDGSYARW